MNDLIREVKAEAYICRTECKRVYRTDPNTEPVFLILISLDLYILYRLSW